jgi:hypothetical protein
MEIVGVDTSVLIVVSVAARHATLQTRCLSSRLWMKPGTRLAKLHLYYRSLRTLNASWV